MAKQFHATCIPYSDTGKFNKIVLDYIDQAPGLKEFYEHPVNIEGIKSAISQRKQFSTNRQLLTNQFTVQYENIEKSDLLKANIDTLLSEKTFTICTAHQPNIFTGHLYFIYKILHVIKIAELLKKEIPEYNFVPVFFMGSEDADLAELNHVMIDGRKYEWQTKQTGAVGRMKIDAQLIQLIDELSGRLLAEPFGNEIVQLLKNCYLLNSTVEEATFLFVHEMFKDYGLLILLPDSAAWKKEMLSIFEDDIFNHTSSGIVQSTSEKLAVNYKAQAYPREINLFYLKDNIRNRIISVGDHFVIQDTGIVFSKEAIRTELHSHPERFSPNVILRGLFQEIILPDIAFVGGGGEIAYWLQLKDLFIKNEVPYPVLILRNSFLIIEERRAATLRKLQITTTDLFKSELALLNQIVERDSDKVLHLEKEKSDIHQIYERITKMVNHIDATLSSHVAALETREMKRLTALEKKMLRAEKKKFSAQKNQMSKLYSTLFPDDGLQERTENFMLFYSKWGNDFIATLYENSLIFEQQFCIIKEAQGERL